MILSFFGRNCQTIFFNTNVVFTSISYIFNTAANSAQKFADAEITENTNRGKKKSA